MTARVHIEQCLECQAPNPGITLLCPACTPQYQPILPAINDSEPLVVAVGDVMESDDD